MENKFELCKDFDQVISLHKNIFHEDNQTFFDNLKTKDYYKTFVISQNQRIIAYCIMSIIAGEAELINIATDVDFRNCGYAKKLLEYSIEHVNANKIFLEVSTDNTNAIKLYNSVGFKQIYIRKNYYGDKDAIIMQYEWFWWEIVLKFEVFGEGNINAIFLHGWGASKTNFLWIKDYLNCTCHFASLDGFDDEPPPDDITIEGYAKRLQKYINDNKLNNVVLVGHSFGGRIAIEYAAHNSLLGLVLVDSAGVKPKFNILKKLKILKYKLAKALCKIGLVNNKYLDRFGSADFKEASDQMKRVMVYAVNHNQKNELNKIKCKTLVVWGKNDKDTPLYMAKIINKKIKNSELAIIDGGHFSFLDDKYKFYTVLDYFIKNL